MTAKLSHFPPMPCVPYFVNLTFEVVQEPSVIVAAYCTLVAIRGITIA